MSEPEARYLDIFGNQSRTNSASSARRSFRKCECMARIFFLLSTRGL